MATNIKSDTYSAVPNSVKNQPLTNVSNNKCFMIKIYISELISKDVVDINTLIHKYHVYYVKKKKTKSLRTI